MILNFYHKYREEKLMDLRFLLFLYICGQIEYAMIIERTLDEVIIRLPATINITDLQEMVNYLRYSELTQKSKVTAKQVDSLVKEVKNGRWERSRKRLIG